MIPKFLVAAEEASVNSEDILNRAWLNLMCQIAECSYCEGARSAGSDACDEHGLWPPRTDFFGPDMIDLLMEMPLSDRLDALERIEELTLRSESPKVPAD